MNVLSCVVNVLWMCCEAMHSCSSIEGWRSSWTTIYQTWKRVASDWNSFDLPRCERELFTSVFAHCSMCSVPQALQRKDVTCYSHSIWISLTPFDIEADGIAVQSFDWCGTVGSAFPSLDRNSLCHGRGTSILYRQYNWKNFSSHSISRKIGSTVYK